MDYRAGRDLRRIDCAGLSASLGSLCLADPPAPPANYDDDHEDGKRPFNALDSSAPPAELDAAGAAVERVRARRILGIFAGLSAAELRMGASPVRI